MKPKLDVFLSSDQEEFRKIRIELAKMIRKMPFLECVPLEFRGAADEDAKSASLKAARNCDIFIGIFGDQWSELTIDEYHEAVKHLKRCLFYVKITRQRCVELTEFINKELKNRFKYHKFKTRKDLYHRVKTDLNQLLFDTLNQGLGAIKRKKAEAQSAEKSIARMAAEPEVQPKAMLKNAQRTYQQEMYLAAVTTAAIAIELSLRNALSRAGLKREELRRPIGWLIDIAVKSRLIDKRELGSLRELQHVRNMALHGGVIPSKETVAWALQVARRLLDSLSG